MYCSLDRIDALVEEDGEAIALQTDHRLAAAIEQRRALSVLFGVSRVFNVRLTDAARCRYVFTNPPPGWFATLLRQVGAAIEVAPDPETVTDDVDHEQVQRVVRDALTELAEGVASTHGWAFELQTLEEVQRTFSEMELDKLHSESAWWTAIAELGAYCGETLRRSLPGFRWALRDDADSRLPFMLEASNGSVLNVFRRCERVLEEGPEWGPTTFFGTPEPGEVGPLMMNLKAYDWPNREAALTTPLVPGAKVQDVPVVAFGNDAPRNVTYLVRSENARSWTSLREEAMRHLTTVSVKIDWIGDGLLIVHGDYYASEKLLDPSFMRTLADTAGDGLLLLVSVPSKGILLAIDGSTNSLEATGKIVALTERVYGDASSKDQISRSVFTVVDGEVMGVAVAGPVSVS